MGITLVAVVNTNNSQYGIWLDENIQINNIEDLKKNKIIFSKTNKSEKAYYLGNIEIVHAEVYMKPLKGIILYGNIIQISDNDGAIIYSTSEIKSLIFVRDPLEGKIIK